MPGLVAVVVIGDFVGVVAEREEQAAARGRDAGDAVARLGPRPDLAAPESAHPRQPVHPSRAARHAATSRRRSPARPTPMRRTYIWPYQMHGSIGPSCSVADVRPDGITLWSGTQNPLMLRTDIARLTGMPEARIAIVRHEAAGCYGRNCADDVGADAALLSRAVGPPRAGAAHARAGACLGAEGRRPGHGRGGRPRRRPGEPVAYDFQTRYPSNGAPTLALLLTGVVEPVAQVFEMGDRTADPALCLRSCAGDRARHAADRARPRGSAACRRCRTPSPMRASSTNSRRAAGVDPIDYRLRHLDDARAADLVRAVAERAGWVPHTVPQTLAPDGDWLRGRGFAYAVYVHGKFPGTAAAWSAWVADVAVNRASGEVAVKRIVVGQDSGLMINPAGVEHQIHGNVIQSTSRVLKEEVAFEAGPAASRDWGAYPILDLPRAAGHRRRDDGPARASRRSASANPPRCRAPPPSPTPSSTRPACASASRPSRPSACAPP